MTMDQIQLNEELSTMHLNVSVYELMQAKEESAETQPLFKQVNNVLLLKGFIAERRIQESYLDIEAEMYKHFGVPDPEDIKKYAAYPMEELGITRKINMMLIYGYMVDFIQPDPSKPVAVQMDQEGAYEKAMKDALTPKPVIYPFFMIIPETANYMFDACFSHVPVSAITGYSRIANKKPTIPSATPPVSMGPGTSGMFISPEDHIKVQKIHEAYHNAIREFEEKYPDKDLEDEIFGELLKKYMTSLIRDKVFKNKDALMKFAEKYSFMLTMMDLTPDQEAADDNGSSDQ